MTNTKQPNDSIDWSLTTWDGARCEALRRWAELPLERIIAALEEMQALSETFASPPVNRAPHVHSGMPTTDTEFLNHLSDTAT